MAKSKLVTIPAKSGSIGVFVDADGDIKITSGGGEYLYDFAMYFTADEALALAQELTAAAFKSMKSKPVVATPPAEAIPADAPLVGAEEF
jgi:hypothetical protein